MDVFSQQEKSLLFLRYLRTFRGPSWFLLFLSLYRILLHLLFLRSLRYLGVFSSQEKSLLLLRLLRYLRTFRGPSWLLLFLSLDSCQICYFCDICGHFGALLGFFSFKVLILVGFVILAIFAKKNLLANRLGTEHVFIRIKMVFFLYALVFWRSATTNKTTEHIQREERGYLRMKAYSSKFPRASYCCGFWIIKQCDTKCTQRCRANVTEKFCEFGQVGRQVGRLFI